MTVSPEKIAEMMAAAEKATPGPRERHVIDASTYRYVEDAEKAVARDQADADFNALCDPQTITALLTELQHRREAEAGRGWVFFNPDSGTEYAESHPIESGEADDAEDIRKSTHFEDFLIEQLREAQAREVAASPSSPASGVRVKALEWNEFERSGGAVYADTLFGRYSVWDFDGQDGHWKSPSGYAGVRVDGGIDAAKAAAQSHHDALILSALGEQS